jgi:hypothetical protein
MIIKGGSRAAPSQLAWHLQRRDTNERVEILELQSPAPTLGEAFRDWQTLVEGTRGFKGLYHANIDPAKDYVMTREQWQRAVDVLEKELGLEGQPRAVVMHEKHEREHIHVVWARTDIDRMVLRSDSQNYLAHERASQALEQEFGHEPVPGKHAKRDREKQPEFPRAEANQAEWQQGERTGIDPATRKDQVTALQQACDNGQTFKTALEEQGYILANGRRGFVIVDQWSNVHSLARQIHDMKTAELRAFMKDVDLDSLPTPEDAKDLQRQRRQERPREEQLGDEHPPHEKAREEGPKPQKSEPESQDPRKEAPQPTETQPSSPLPEQAPDALQAQTEALRKAVSERQAEERRKLAQSQTEEMNQLRDRLDRETREKLDRFDALHQGESEDLHAEQKEARSGLAGFIDAFQSIFSPARAAEREAERQREHEELAARQKQERDDYVALLRQTNDLEVENLTERQALSLHDHAVRGEEDLARYLRELETAHRLQAEIEERERQREEELARKGLERPPPTRAR